jgi:hypothetical protein
MRKSKDTLKGRKSSKSSIQRMESSCDDSPSTIKRKSRYYGDSDDFQNTQFSNKIQNNGKKCKN